MSDSVQREMPRYRSHKEVWALKIAEVIKTNGDDGPSVILRFEDEGYAPKEVTLIYVAKHDPKPGGYYVVYKGGYESWSPAEAFESGYTRID